MRKMIAILGLMLAMACPVWAQDYNWSQLYNLPRYFTVTVKGDLEAESDMTVVSFGIVKRAQEADVAFDALAADIKAIHERLSAITIASPRDMQNPIAYLYPKYEDSPNLWGGQPKLVGFSASATIVVQVDDLARLGEIMSAVTLDGTNELGGLSFQLPDRRPAEGNARVNVIKDTMSRAKELADAAGVSLGRLHYANVYAAGFTQDTDPANAWADMSIVAGELQNDTTVSITYELSKE